MIIWGDFLFSPRDGVSCICVTTDQSQPRNVASSGRLVRTDKRSGAAGFGFMAIARFMAPAHSESPHIICSPADPPLYHVTRKGSKGKWLHNRQNKCLMYSFFFSSKALSFTDVVTSHKTNLLTTDHSEENIFLQSNQKD